MAKIQRNDPCPCGSGKKYKQCCGKAENKAFTEYSYKETDLHLVDFVMKHLDEDFVFLLDALQGILGPNGYGFEHITELKAELFRDGFKAYVESDHLNLHKNIDDETRLYSSTERAYSTPIPEKQYDVIQLLREKIICEYEVSLFHAYVIDNLKKRFDDYLYVPSKAAIKGQKFGAFAHRGYDFLLASTLLLELQLGVHIYYIEAYKNTEIAGKAKSEVNRLLNLDNTPYSDMPDGFYIFLLSYADVLVELMHNFDIKTDVEMYRSIGAYSNDREYEAAKSVINRKYTGVSANIYSVDYIFYLKTLIISICTGNDSCVSCVGFPQCDYLKFIMGMEDICTLFEQKLKEKTVTVPAWLVTLDPEKNTDDIHSYKITRKDVYDSAVFHFFDEINGFFNSIKTEDLVYKDDAEINEDEFTLVDGGHKTNPARKTTRTKPIRKLVMELYDSYNGKNFKLYDEKDGEKVILGSYPILPWLSSGSENTIHCEPWDRQTRDLKDLFSADPMKRMKFLTMEYRLTNIPVNCVEEFLNPDVFKDWAERNDLLNELKKKNQDLEEKNRALERHIKLNEDLVQNLTHSSANYLNSNNLRQTGLKLHNAVEGDPGVDILKEDGLMLLLQSEKEDFLKRKLDSLKLHCRADGSKLRESLRKSITHEDGVDIYYPLDFAIKSLMSRILFRQGDIRADFIKEKLGFTGEKYIQLRSSFILDVLADKTGAENLAINWWKSNIGNLNILLSSKWETIKILKDRDFYDFISDIFAEQLLNVLSHGDITKPVEIELGQEEGTEKHPKWVYVRCKNTVGEHYSSGLEKGIDTLNGMMLSINSNNKGVETTDDKTPGTQYEVTVWIAGQILG